MNIMEHVFLGHVAIIVVYMYTPTPIGIHDENHSPPSPHAQVRLGVIRHALASLEHHGGRETLAT